MSILSTLAEGDVAGVYETLRSMARMYAIENRLLLPDDDGGEVIVLLMAGFAIEVAQELVQSMELQHET